MRLEEISLSEIVGTAAALRRQEDRFARQLLDSILQHGLIRPLLLNRTAEGYEVVLGARRWMALRTLKDLGTGALPSGMAWIDDQGEVRTLSLVAEGLTQDQATVMGFVDNEVARTLSPFEQAMCYQTMTEAWGLAGEEVAARLGKDPGEVQRGIDALAKLSDPGILAWQRGELSAGHVAQLVRVDSESVRQELLERTLREGLSEVRLAFLVDQSRPPDAVAPSEKPLHDLRRRLAQDAWVSRRMEAGKVVVAGSRTGDRLTIDYASPEELREAIQKVGALLSKSLERPI